MVNMAAVTDEQTSRALEEAHFTYNEEKDSYISQYGIEIPVVEVQNMVKKIPPTMFKQVILGMGNAKRKNAPD